MTHNEDEQEHLTEHSLEHPCEPEAKGEQAISEQNPPTNSSLPALKCHFIHCIDEIPAAQWDALWQSDYPFIQHSFLSALEQSGATCSQSGWQPYHLIVRNHKQELTAAMVLYAKSHSYGEYVFDWSWADAYHNNGLDYYPKLVNAIPFTPATGPRFAAATTTDRNALFSAIGAHLKSQKMSGFHCLFPAQAHSPILSSPTNALPLSQRLGCQFHWFNHGYTDFDDFLSRMASRKRKNIKKERAKVQGHNLRITSTLGTALTADDWQGFYRLYQLTYIKRSGHNGYLNADFFILMGQALAKQTLLVRAYKASSDEQTTEAQKPLAAALYLFDNQTLYGRYWGATHELDGLHFECCYYRGIEFAIAKGLTRFDPGAQGEHKIARGFTPVLTQSYHALSHPSFNQAIQNFLQEETPHIKAYCEQARENLPFNAEHNDELLPKPEHLVASSF